MELEFLGGCHEVGRSALLVNDTVLIDFGMKPGHQPQYPVETPEPEAVVVSHGHLDHVGALPMLLAGSNRPTMHMTPPTRDLARLLCQDTIKLYGGRFDCPFTQEEVATLSEVIRVHGYHETFQAAGHDVTFFNAGHIPGSAHILINDGTTQLLYTGDYHTEPQRLVDSTRTRPQADVVVTESTYVGTDHPPRSETEAQFVELARSTRWEGGTVIVPAFAIGRTQELLMVCAAHDIPCYVDGMGTEVSSILKQYPEFVRSPTDLSRAISHARTVTGGDAQRSRISHQNNLIITTAGMLTGGPVVAYLPHMYADPTNTIIFTGYQVAGTPGRELLDSGSVTLTDRYFQVSATVEQLDFSAHADENGLRAFLSEYSESQIFVMHGDQCDSFATALSNTRYTATAPHNGETITVT
jgi:putative mRNA 3-end processing factor